MMWILVVMASAALVAVTIGILALMELFGTGRRARTNLPAVRRSAPPGAAQGGPIDPRWALQVVAVAAQEWRRHEMEARPPGRGTTP